MSLICGNASNRRRQGGPIAVGETISLAAAVHHFADTPASPGNMQLRVLFAGIARQMVLARPPGINKFEFDIFSKLIEMPAGIA